MYNPINWCKNRNSTLTELLISKYLIRSLKTTLESMDDERLYITDQLNKYDALARIKEFEKKYKLEG